MVKPDIFGSIKLVTDGLGPSCIKEYWQLQPENVVQNTAPDYLLHHCPQRALPRAQ